MNRRNVLTLSGLAVSLYSRCGPLRLQARKAIPRRHNLRPAPRRRFASLSQEAVMEARAGACDLRREGERARVRGDKATQENNYIYISRTDYTATLLYLNLCTFCNASIGRRLR